MNYYLIERENNNSYPLLRWGDDDENIEILFAKNKEVNPSHPVDLRLGSPIPKKPQMVDFHKLPEHVYSRRVAAVLSSLKLFNVQLVPACVAVGNVSHDYGILYVRNFIECIDLNRSKLGYRTDGKTISMVDKLSLDSSKLKQVPEERRLVFSPSEFDSIYLYHEKIKSLIESLNPVGLRFFSVDEWDDAASFRK